MSSVAFSNFVPLDVSGEIAVGKNDKIDRTNLINKEANKLNFGRTALLCGKSIVLIPTYGVARDLMLNIRVTWRTATKVIEKSASLNPFKIIMIGTTGLGLTALASVAVAVCIVAKAILWDMPCMIVGVFYPNVLYDLQVNADGKVEVCESWQRSFSWIASHQFEKRDPETQKVDSVSLACLRDRKEGGREVPAAVLRERIKQDWESDGWSYEEEGVWPVLRQIILDGVLVGWLGAKE